MSAEVASLGTRSAELLSASRTVAKSDTRTPVDELSTFARWGWGPLVAGCIAVSFASFGLWEVVLYLDGRAPIDPVERALLAARALTISVALATWTGYYVLQSRRRVEAARAQLRTQQLALAWRAEQAAALGALSRVLAHEIRNPLNALVLHCTVIERTVASCCPESGETILRTAEVLHREALRLEHLVRDYLDHGRSSDMALHIEPVALDRLLDRFVALYEVELEQRGIHIVTRKESVDTTVHADPERLTQVLVNLVRNAEQALVAGGTIELAVRVEGDYVVLTVTDDGPGFEDPKVVFRPFFTTKSGGSGLGLAVVRDMVRAHAGEVYADNVTPKGGARVTVRLARSHAHGENPGSR